jgi:hypothetical protein
VSVTRPSLPHLCVQMLLNVSRGEYTKPEINNIEYSFNECPCYPKHGKRASSCEQPRMPLTGVEKHKVAFFYQKNTIYKYDKNIAELYLDKYKRWIKIIKQIDLINIL